MTTYTTEKSSAKKPYDPPRLVVYGDVREITQTRVSGPITSDGSASGPHNSG